MSTSTRPALRALRRLLVVSLLPGFVFLLLAGLWTGVSYQIAVEHGTALNEAVAHSQSMAYTLADYTSHILRQTEHATQLFKLKFEETQGRQRLADFTRRGGLFDSVLPARLGLPIALIDKDGNVVDSEHAFMAKNVGDQAWFRAHASGEADGTLFNTPMVEPKTMKWNIQVSRRLDDRNGDFAGVIVVMIDPALFVEDYDRINLEDGDAVVMMSRDAGLAIGRTGERLILSDRLDFVRPADPARPADEVVPTRPFDSIARIYSYRDMPRFSLVAIVGLTENAMMAKFRRDRLIYLGTAGVATLLILLVSTLLMVQSARLRRSMRAAHEAQATLRAAAEASLDGVFLLRAWPGGKRKLEDFVIVDVNDRGAAMTGHTRAELLGRRVCDVIPRTRQPHFFGRYAAVLDSGQPIEEEYENVYEDGRSRWMHRQVVPIPNGVAITSRDITERKHAELEVRNSRNFLQSLIDHLPALVYVKSVCPNNYGRMVVWNAAAARATGFAAADVIGRLDGAAFPLDFDLRDEERDRAMLAAPGLIERAEQPLRHPDGSVHYLHSVSVPLFDEAGQIEYIMCIAEDVTERLAQEQALRQNRAELAAVNDASPLGLIRFDSEGRCSYVNRTFESITGLTRARALGEGWRDAIHPDDRAAAGLAQVQARERPEPVQSVLRCLHPDGRVLWTSVKVAAVRVDGEVLGFVGSIEDITTLREAEIALRESEARLRTIADTLPTMVAYIDADQIYRFHNSAYEREFGNEGMIVHGMSIRDTVGEVRYAALEPYIARVLAGETLLFEEEDQRNGVERHLEVTYIPQLGEDGHGVVGFHVMRQDVTSQKREERRLRKLAQIDALTGLTNRAGFMQKLSDAMLLCAAESKLMGVMYMDIDRFKPVNDTYGHHVGDALLKAFSARLTHTLRASDTIARLGGDEFTIIMEKLPRREDASLIADKIVHAMQVPFDLDEITVSVSASIGLAFYHDEAITPDALLKEADALLYQAKQAGRNTFRAALV